MNQFLAFLGVVVLIIVTPGPDTVLTVRGALLFGRRAGIATAAGVASGQLLWALATSAGLAALVVAWEPLFATLRLAGAIYLVCLGVLALISMVRHGGGPDVATAADRMPQRRALTTAYRRGLISNLGNPKAVVFFAGLLPQFVAANASFLDIAGHGAVMIMLTFCWLSCYAVTVARFGDVLRRPTVHRTIEGVTGTVLVAFGLRLATEQR